MGKKTKKANSTDISELELKNNKKDKVVKKIKNEINFISKRKKKNLSVDEEIINNTDNNESNTTVKIKQKKNKIKPEKNQAEISCLEIKKKRKLKESCDDENNEIVELKSRKSKKKNLINDIPKEIYYVDEETINNTDNNKSEAIVKIKQKKNKIIPKPNEEVVNSKSNLETKKKKKLKETCDDDVNEIVEQKSRKTKKHKQEINDSKPIPKGSLKKKSKRQKTNDLSADEDFNEDDIDKFCDELDESDNQQFDNWVKLIETKIHEKKIK